MQKILYVLIGLIIFGTVLYGKGYEKEFEIGGDVKSIGFYECNNNEDYSKITAFEYKDEVYVFEYKNITDDNLYSFGDFKYIEGQNTVVVGFWNNPGGDKRIICIVKLVNNKLKLLGVITSGNKGSLVEVKNPQDISYNINRWKMEDFDNDGKNEILIYLGEIGYIFVEINDKNISIDYNKKNYKKIKPMIKSKKELKFNDKFISGNINKKEVEKLIMFDNIEEYNLHKKMRIEIKNKLLYTE